MAILQTITNSRSFKAKLETHGQPAAVDFDDKDISEDDEDNSPAATVSSAPATTTG